MDNDEQISPMMRNHLLEQEINKIRKWKEEGVTKEEAIERRSKQVVKISDIDKIYNEPIEKTESLENDNPIESSKEIINSDDKKNIKKTENNNEDKKILSTEIENKEYKELTDEQLIDFYEQPFKLYDEEQKKEMIRSIKINGIIQPLIVRPIENDKYQILSGHNRRICGREAGLKTFPCKVKYDLTDSEAELYMVDTNLATRKKISPMERAKALLIRKNAYRTEKIKLKIEKGIYEDNLDDIDVRKKIQEVENMSDGNIQRYLRLNFLNENLQRLADEGRISLKVAENLSFLKKDKQSIVSNLIEKNNIKINENQAKKLKEDEDLTKEKISNLLIKNKKENDTIIIKFSKEEIEKYFDNLNTNEIKEKILELLSNV